MDDVLRADVILLGPAPPVECGTYKTVMATYKTVTATSATHKTVAANSLSETLTVAWMTSPARMSSSSDPCRPIAPFLVFFGGGLAPSYNGDWSKWTILDCSRISVSEPPVEACYQRRGFKSQNINSRLTPQNFDQAPPILLGAAPPHRPLPGCSSRGSAFNSQNIDSALNPQNIYLSTWSC